MRRGGSLVLVVGLWATVAHAQTVDLPAFIAQLDQIDALIEDPGPMRGRVAEILVRMPGRLGVHHGDQRFEVSLEPLAQRLVSEPRRATEHLKVLRAELHAIREQAATLLAADATVRDADLRGHLQSILDRREYSRLRQTSWWTTLRRRVGEWLASWLDRLGGDRLDTRGLGTVLAWTVVIAALVGLATIYVRRTRTRQRPFSPEADPGVTTARAWGLRALAAARAGDVAEAVRAGYHAAIARFSERGAWRVDEARTAREYLELLGPGDTMRPIFADIAAQFERVFYGQRSLTPADLAVFIQHLETLGCVPAQQPSI
jgi:hypothetical protein